MHPPCAVRYADLENLVDIYHHSIDAYANRTTLCRIFNHLIVKRQLTPDYLKFAVRYIAAHHLEIRKPPNLFYMVVYDEIQDAWKKRQAAQQLKQMQDKHPQTACQSDDVTFIWHKNDKSNFGDLFGGDTSQ